RGSRSAYRRMRARPSAARASRMRRSRRPTPPPQPRPEAPFDSVPVRPPSFPPATTRRAHPTPRPVDATGVRVGGSRTRAVGPAFTSGGTEGGTLMRSRLVILAVAVAAIGASGVIGAASGASPHTTSVVYDNFQAPGGYTLADYAAKWSNGFGLG